MENPKLIYDRAVCLGVSHVHILYVFNCNAYKSLYGQTYRIKRESRFNLKNEKYYILLT